MQYQQVYDLWCARAVEDPDLRAELAAVQGDEAAVADRFYRDLAFGTGGLRGVIGAGSNRMNIYTIRRATQGLADYINAEGLPKKVAVAHDSRIKGDLFSREAARVLAANGITAWLYPRLEPTPALSWAVRYLGCGAGICVTASHNPAQYNGYKVYGADGCQITLEAAAKVLAAIGQHDYFDSPKLADYDEAVAAGSIRAIPDACLSDFVDAVLALRPGNDVSKLKLVYTPLNGSGLEPVKLLLERMGVTQLTVVPEQAQPDGNFPTCPYPNPEIRQAMEAGLKLCDAVRPDLMIGTDPDCDRMGAAVPDGQGGYRLITGNEMGVLLLDYICRTRAANGTMPEAPVAVTTIVSTDMADPIARKYGVELRRTLTGFKFIGEQIGLLEAEGHAERYIFGFEESYGYLSGGHVRDKDGVNAVMLACEAAAWYAARGMSLLDAVNALYKEYGFYRSALKSYTFEGESGMRTMQGIMARLRADEPFVIAGYGVDKVIDYQRGGTGLPKADVLEYRLENGAKLMVRPSGTEPKIKVYLSAVAGSEAEADAINERLAEAAGAWMQA
ncbi:MAG TPA: phospho-sugar mutase [Candidatus Gemmiger avistercoris]|uniref:phosphoglucomutase (alpha-D-glucose-1,6-bisphosphate-dependent) n=1 Tax=Candidatus Gemmiger avistercoris TaxID=2838606 RepID=A0A9D2FIP0_9FIRM|nr:phospho-sugar mutase [uncultured Subdoligranulum sp.]HIZ61784.1 phospho-sugar mutase [Candidatus Gemmiger avistercoris]